jgi:hypothetical protein
LDKERNHALLQYQQALGKLEKKRLKLGPASERLKELEQNEAAKRDTYTVVNDHAKTEMKCILRLRPSTFERITHNFAVVMKDYTNNLRKGVRKIKQENMDLLTEPVTTALPQTTIHTKTGVIISGPISTTSTSSAIPTVMTEQPVFRETVEVIQEPDVTTSIPNQTTVPVQYTEKTFHTVLPETETTPQEWYYVHQDIKHGPYSYSDLQQNIATNRIPAEAAISNDQVIWTPLQQLDGYGQLKSSTVQTLPEATSCIPSTADDSIKL